MTIHEFANLLQRIDQHLPTAIPHRLATGIRMLNQTTPDDDSLPIVHFGLSAWAHFFRIVAATQYPPGPTP